MGLHEDQLPGGKGDNSGPQDVDQEQLKMGIKVEMEHTHDADLAKEIALDHLSEDPQYYSHLKSAGMADELPNGQQPAQVPMMQKLISPTAIMPTPVIAVGVRGTKTGLLPAGGVVSDPEKARLGGLEKVEVLPQGGAKMPGDNARYGGLEPVSNPKANSQGAFANTPSSDAIKADGGHYTPDNKDISQGKGPETSKKGTAANHPMQIQQIGNPPTEDDGTGRNGEGLKLNDPEPTEPHPMSGPVAGPEGGTGAEKDLSKAGIDDAPEEDEGEPKKGPWGIELDGDEEEDEEEEEDKDEGEDVSIDIKETLQEATKEDKVKYVDKTGTEKDVAWVRGRKDDPDFNEKDAKQFRQDRSNSPAGEMVRKHLGMKECGDCGCGNPADSHGMKSRFQKLANIPTTEAGLTSEDGERSDYDIASTETSPIDYVECPKCHQPNHICHCDNEMPSTRKWAQDALKRKQLEELVGRLNAKGKVTPLLKKAQAYLVKSKSK